MRGTVEKINTTYAFIRGSDGVSRFFIPSSMHRDTAFDTLRIGAVVEFTHIDHPKGPRAIEVAAVGPQLVDLEDSDGN